MKPTKKIILLVFLALTAFVLYTLISTGFFRAIENKFDGQVFKEIALPGAEDITISHSDQFALISSTDRKGINTTEEEKGGLYYMPLDKEEFKLIPLTTSFTKPFAPHGVFMHKKDSTYKVMAVNHTPSGHSLEVFTLKDTVLTYQKTLTDSSMISPNDVVMIDENRFYFTNDHGYTKGLGKFVEEYGGLSVSNVIYFDGENYKEVAGGIAYANGINYDAKRNLLYVASPRKFMVKVYTVNEDGSLTHIEDIDCGTGVDNIEFDEEGNLWIGSHPDLIGFSQYAKGQKETSPSEIIKISYRSKNDYTIDQIYIEDGKTMSASTVAAPFKDLILTGNVMDDTFLILQQKN